MRPLSIMALSIMCLFVTLHIKDTQHKCHPLEQDSVLSAVIAKWYILFIVMLSAIMLKVIMLSIARPSIKIFGKY